MNGDLDQAEETAKKGLEMLSSIGLGDVNGIFGYTLGTIYYERGDYAIASDWFLSSALNQPDKLEVWMKASTLTFPVDARNDARAEEVLVQAIPRFPENLFIQYQLGLVMQRTNRVETAIMLFEHTLTKNPDMPDVHAALARAYHSNGLFQQALTNYEIADKRSHRDVAMLVDYARLLCHKSIGRFRDGLQKAGEALQAKPDSEDAQEVEKSCKNSVLREVAEDEKWRGEDM